MVVGGFDGSVGIYDLRFYQSPSKLKPLFHTGQIDFKHLGPVNQLKWIDRGNERGEVLVSISSDGQVVEWSIKKGLEVTLLMKLKKLSTKTERKNAAFISRQIGGICFEFHKLDKNM